MKTSTESAHESIVGPITAGQIIRALRQQRGITQEALAEGIMDRTNLTRIEMGIQDISHQKLTLFIERLGYSMRKYFPYMINTTDNEFYEMRIKINAILGQYRTAGVNKMLDDMEKNPKYQDNLYRQFILKSRAMVHMISGKNMDEAYALLLEAIHITLPRFDEAKVNRYLLATDDHELLRMLAEIHYTNGEYTRAIDLLTLQYDNACNKIMDVYEKTLTATYIAGTLTFYLNKQKQYRKSLGLCNNAIKMAQDNRTYGMLPTLLGNKAYALHNLGKSEKVESLLRQVYYLFLALGQTESADNVINHARDDMGIILNINR